MNTYPTWTIKLTNSSLLKSKQDYQRDINMKFVRDAIAEFDPDKVEPVHVLIVMANIMLWTDSILY